MGSDTKPWQYILLSHEFTFSAADSGAWNRRLANFELRVGMVNGNDDFSKNTLCAYQVIYKTFTQIQTAQIGFYTDSNSSNRLNEAT